MRQPTKAERQDLLRAIFALDLPTADVFSQRFAAYFDNYCSVVCPSSSGDAVVEVETPALKSHADVLSCIQIIVNNPRISYNQFVLSTFHSDPTRVSRRERDHVARVTVHAAFGVNCTQSGHYPNTFSGNAWHYNSWEDDIPLLSFFENAFKCASLETRTLEHRLRTLETIKHKTSLKAWKLVKRYGINIKATNNLVEHLELDLQTMTLKVFHQVSFLRAHLAKSKHEPLDLCLEDSLKRLNSLFLEAAPFEYLADPSIRGTLPPKLLLETLLTFHSVLFPIASLRDSKSRAALDSAIGRQNFDAETRWIEFVRTVPTDMMYDYWGDRLVALYDVVKRPPPTNAIVAWFERHTSERNALTIAIAGLFLSALFGLLSFVVGLLQLVLAWMAYKNPPAATA
jgi:hypothetical protein